MKLNRNQKAKIRYQLYRDAGYSAIEARKLRYQSYIDISGIKIDKTTNKVIKKRNYKRVKNVIRIDDTISRLRQVPNTSVYTRHGFLLNSKYKGEYNSAVMAIKRRDKLTTDQAYYFAHFMLESGYSYEFTRRELLSSKEFEIYEQKKRGGKR